MSATNDDMWKTIEAAAADAKSSCPSQCKIAAEKWGYTCGSRVIVNHLFSVCFAAIPRSTDAVKALLRGEPVRQLADLRPPSWNSLSKLLRRDLKRGR